jgi:hypothetical protein
MPAGSNIYHVVLIAFSALAIVSAQTQWVISDLSQDCNGACRTKLGSNWVCDLGPMQLIDSMEKIQALGCPWGTARTDECPYGWGGMVPFYADFDKSCYFCTTHSSSTCESSHEMRSRYCTCTNSVVVLPSSQPSTQPTSHPSFAPTHIVSTPAPPTTPSAGRSAPQGQGPTKGTTKTTRRSSVHTGKSMKTKTVDVEVDVDVRVNTH